MYRIVKKTCNNTGKEDLFFRLSGKIFLALYQDIKKWIGK
jgi:hypothetical protein